MLAYEFSELGQLRPAGPVPNQYTQKSTMAIPFAREQQLIASDKLSTLKPPMAVVNWPGSIQPPPIPDSSEEDKQIECDMQRVLWKRGYEPYSWNTASPYKANWTMDGLEDINDVLPWAVIGAGALIGITGVRQKRMVLSISGGLVAVIGLWALLAK